MFYSCIHSVYQISTRTTFIVFDMYKRGLVIPRSKAEVSAVEINPVNKISPGRKFKNNFQREFPGENKIVLFHYQLLTI